MLTNSFDPNHLRQHENRLRELRETARNEKLARQARENTVRHKSRSAWVRALSLFL